jgi:hypothetical protein
MVGVTSGWLMADLPSCGGDVFLVGGNNNLGGLLQRVISTKKCDYGGGDPTNRSNRSEVASRLR